MSRRYDGKYLAQLAAVPLFSACSRRELEFVARFAERTTLLDGTTLLRRERECREFFVLLDGEVSLEYAGGVAELACAGDYFGHVALMARAPSDVTVTARGSVRVLILGAQSFRAVRDSCPSVDRKLAANIAQRLWTEFALHAGPTDTHRRFRVTSVVLGRPAAC